MALVSEPMSGDRLRRWRSRLAAHGPVGGWATARRLPAGASFVAGVVALLGALGLSSLVVEPSGAVLPIDPSSLNAVDAVASAVALLALSVGLARGKKLAWYLAIATFGSAMVLQLVVEGHAIAGSLAGICLLVLIGDRLRYRARTDGRLVWPVAIALGLGAGSESRRPLGYAIVGGIFFSTLLTLFVVPVVWVLLERALVRRTVPAPALETAEQA